MKAAPDIAKVMKWWHMEDRYFPRSLEELVADMILRHNAARLLGIQ